MFSRLKKSKDSRRLLENFLSLGFLQIASYIFPLLTVPYLAHVIGASLLGEIAFAGAVMVYFQTLVDYGFVYSGVRDIARNRTNKEKVSEIYSKVMCSRFLLLCISIIILFILILAVPKFTSLSTVLILSFFIVVGHTLFPDWMFQGMEKMKYITIFNVAVKLLFTICVFIFINKPEDYILQPIFLSLGYILCGIGSMHVIHRWGIRLHKVSFNEIFISLKRNIDLFLNILVPNLYSSTSVLFLGFWHGNSANGIFDAANRFNSAGSSFFSIISRTFYPFLARRMDRHKFFEKLDLICALAISALLFIFAPFIIRLLFPPEFEGAIPTLRIMAVSLIFLAMIDIYGTNSLLLAKKEKTMRQITIVSSLIGLASAIPLVYLYSYIGVAYSILISRFLIGTLSLVYSKRLQNQNHIPR